MSGLHEQSASTQAEVVVMVVVVSWCGGRIHADDRRQSQHLSSLSITRICSVKAENRRECVIMACHSKQTQVCH
jgi:hypothetical protein